MKKFSLLIALFLMIQLAAKSQNPTSPKPISNDTANYPYWVGMMQDESVNFFKVKRAFNLYWEHRKITKGCGWKPFKRWEYMMEARVLPDGTRPPADQTFREFEAYKKNTRSVSGTWTSLGPATIPLPGPAGYEGLGRLNVVAFHPTDPNKLYVGSPSGGMWQTTDGGVTWVSHTDSMPTLGVSAILVDKNNTNTILIGTGDRDAGDAAGMGVFKSTDNGVSWSAWNTGMGTKTVGKIIQHPTNTSILIAATNGGVYKSTNGGSNWTQSVSGDFRDVTFKPNDPNTVYACGGNGIFYRSTNGGTSFTHITAGLPGGQRSTMAVSLQNPDYVYVIMSDGSSGFQGLYRSVNSGVSFTTQSTTPNILDWSCDGSGTGGQGWYDLSLACNPNNANELYAGGVDIWRSTDGGVTWTINAHWYGGCSVPAVHADCHSLTYSATDGKLYATVDGGVYSTNNSGAVWTDHTVGLTIGQIYKLGQSQTVRDEVINGFQDNGTYTYVGANWLATGGGDGMECAIDWTDGSWTYHTVYYGDIYRKHNNNNEVHVAGNGVGGIIESGAWVTPFLLHCTNNKTMFVGYKNIWRCLNVRDGNNPSWTQISNVGNTDMTALAQSPANPDIFYASNSANKLYRSDDVNADSPSWMDLTTHLPATGTPSSVAPHPTDPNTVVITLGNKVYKSTDKGLTWVDFSGSLPNIHFNTVTWYKNAVDGLYAGADAGVYYRDATMSDWIFFGTGLPINGRITELEIYYDNDSVSQDVIRASSYGRGLWSSDLYHGTPVADFKADRTTIPVQCSVNFTDLSSGIPTYFEWSFPGGTPSSSTLKNPSNIVYGTPGTYLVKMKCWNENGSDSVTKTGYITVSGTLLPVVNFMADKRILCEGETVQFTDLSDNCPAAWQWTITPNTFTYLNGTSQYSQNPAVSFQQSGYYTVTLMAVNGVGSNSVTKTDYILQDGFALPFTEDFENGFDGKQWTTVNSDMGMTWDTITVAGTTPGHIAAWMNNYVYTGYTKRDQLISPPLNLTGYTAANLTFEHAYAQRSSLKDSLIVKISEDCGTTWTRVLAVGPDGSANTFVTHANTMNAFYPASATDWCNSSYGTSCYVVDVSSIAGKKNVKVMFENYNGRSNNLFIDNINISGMVGMPKENEGKDGISVYPNPTTGKFTVQFAKGFNSCHAEVFNIQGQSVSKMNWQNLPDHTTRSIDLTGSNKGVYYLRLTTGTLTKIEKIIIE
jgi:PKD repeat protein/photosystem II stability/assembly factor-like uncharacterized protein